MRSLERDFARHAVVNRLMPLFDVVVETARRRHFEALVPRPLYRLRLRQRMRLLLQDGGSRVANRIVRGGEA